ncbi:prepilin-type N-terminal cleavage/methylation domain-containing protein [Candidatus Uhrbacteria bacterium]|nr:prepilin-type N-terminal cleavage/methylation domain-containing protein [Candidatus Uhrbacteria bacterium]
MGGYKNNNSRGQTLIEVVLVTALFAILASGIMSALITSSHSAQESGRYLVANGYIEEAMQAVRSIRDRDWSQIINGTHGFSTVNGFYEFSGTSDLLGIYTRTTTIENVYRFGGITGPISGTGTLDSNSKRVTINVRWQTSLGIIRNIDSVFYVFNWDDQAWTESGQSEYVVGFRNSTDIANVSDGEIVLRENRRDWSNLEMAHEIDLEGNGDRIALDFDVPNDILYILSTNTSGYEFVAIDVSNVSASAPTIIGGYDLAGLTATDLAVHDGYAYIATNDNAQEIIVINVITMTVVNIIDIEGSDDVSGVAATGNLLAIARDEEAYFYDISNPEGSLTQLAETELEGNLSDVAVSGTHAFFVGDDNNEEFFVVRLSDFTEVNSYNLSGSYDVNTVEIVGTNAYIGRQNGTGDDLHSLDISNPEGTITQTASLDVGASVFDIGLDGVEDYIFLTTDDNAKELIVVKRSTFAQSSFLDLVGNDNARAVVNYGAHLYVGTDNNTQDFIILQTELGGWGSAAVVGDVDKLGSQDPTSIVIQTGFAYIATSENPSQPELFIYDISIPTSPVYLGAFEVGSTINDFVVQGDFAYLSTTDDNRELDIVDVGNKASPSREGSFNAEGSTDGNSVAVSGSTVYLGRLQDSGAEFLVINTATLSSPTLSGFLEIGADVNDLKVDNTEVYAATSANTSELVVINVSNPSSPSIQDTQDLSGTENGMSIALSGDLLLLGRENGGTIFELAAIDITNPSAMSVLSEAEIGGSVLSLSMEDGIAAYLATDETDKEFQRWDISNELLMEKDVTFDTNASTSDVVFNGTYAFVANSADASEIQILTDGDGVTEFSTEGSYTSRAFDSGSEVQWDKISWSSSGTGTITFRIRTANTQANLSTARWVGSLGTIQSLYSTNGTSIITDPSASGTRWIQWKAYLSGNGSSTPILEDVTLEFTP